MGIIYIITNNETNKKYIGQTIKTMNERWYEHKQCAKRLKKYGNVKSNKDIAFSYLYNAMVKYGIDKFDIQALADIDSRLLNKYETYYIDLFNTIAPNGYNLTSGGDSGYALSEATKLLIKRQKHANIDNVRNEKLIGLPVYTAYRNHKTLGEQILINGHPLCKHKTFSAINYGSFDSTKKAVIDFIDTLERNGFAHNSKNNPELPKGLVKTNKGYRVNKIFSGKTYDKRFEIKSISDEENKKNAIDYYNKMFTQNP